MLALLPFEDCWQFVQHCQKPLMLCSLDPWKSMGHYNSLFRFNLYAHSSPVSVINWPIGALLPALSRGGIGTMNRVCTDMEYTHGVSRHSSADMPAQNGYTRKSY
jgi:hypothetical protein